MPFRRVVYSMRLSDDLSMAFVKIYGKKYMETNISFTLGEKPLKIMKEKAILDDICIGFA